MFCFVRHTLVAAGVQAAQETRFLLPGDDAGLKSADCFARAWTGGRDTSFDLVTVHPCQQNHVELSAVNRGQGSGYFLKVARNRKLRLNKERLQRQGVAFFPLTVCAFGSWRKVAQDQIKKVAAALSRHTGQVKSTAVSHLSRRLSVTLQNRRPQRRPRLQDGGRPSQRGWNTVSQIQLLQFQNYRIFLVLI